MFNFYIMFGALQMLGPMLGIGGGQQRRPQQHYRQQRHYPHGQQRGRGRSQKGGNFKDYLRNQYIKTRNNRIPTATKFTKKIIGSVRKKVNNAKKQYLNKLIQIDRKIMNEKPKKQQKGGGAALGMLAAMMLPQLLPTVGQVLKVDAKV